MSEPKRVELTEAEREELELDLQEYWHEADLTGPPQDKVIASVARIKAAARREALLEAEKKHRVEVERLTDAFTDAARVGHDNAKAYLTERRRIARVEALADCPPGDCEGHPCIWPEDLRAALAEPERDEEPCSCGSRDATSLTPGERLHHSPDGCTIERGGEDGR